MFRTLGPAIEWSMESARRSNTGVAVHVLEIGSEISQLSAFDTVSALMGVAEPSQVVATLPVVELSRHTLKSGWSYVDLGRHALGSGIRNERIFALAAPGLRTSPAIGPKSGPLDSTIVGRFEELELLRRAVDLTRCIGIVGGPGVGKSALARRFEAEVRDDFVDGTLWVNLEGVEREAAIAPRIAAALEISPPRQGIHEALIASLRNRASLLVLDNLHSVQRAGRLIEHLLETCPHLQILYTAGQRGNLNSEWVLSLEGLGYCTPHAELEEIAESPAMQVLVEQIQRDRPKFALTDRNARTLARVCARLEGNPRAIVMAAKSLRVMSSTRFLGKLESLPGVALGTEERGLAAAIGATLKLASRNARLLVERLGIFEGAFSLEMLEEIVADKSLPAGDIPSALMELAGLHLVTESAQPDGDPAYRLPWLVRDFIHQNQRKDRKKEQLAAEIAMRRDGWLRPILESLLDKVDATDYEAVDQMGMLVPEVYGFVRRLSQSPETVDEAFQICLRLVFYWWASGNVAEGLELVTELLSIPGSTDQPLMPRLANVAALATFWAGDLEGAKGIARSALGIAVATKNRVAESRLLNSLSMFMGEEDDSVRAIRYQRRASKLFAALGEHALANLLLCHCAGSCWQIARFAEGDKVFARVDLTQLSSSDLLTLDLILANRFLVEKDFEKARSKVRDAIGRLAEHREPTSLATLLSIATRICLASERYAQADTLASAFLGFRPFGHERLSPRNVRRQREIRAATMAANQHVKSITYEEAFAIIADNW